MFMNVERKLTSKIFKGVMYFPEDKPEAFSLLIDWLYRRILLTGHT